MGHLDHELVGFMQDEVRPRDDVRKLSPQNYTYMYTLQMHKVALRP